jgi:hypothetical protein
MASALPRPAGHNRGPAERATAPPRAASAAGLPVRRGRRLEHIMRKRLPRRALLLAALLLVTIGCNRITVIDAGGSAPPAAATQVPSAAHDLAISGIDFDPPLDKLGGLPAGDFLLLVVIENRGTEREQNVQVNLRLTGDSPQDVVLQGSRRLPELAAGQTRVERFPFHLPIAPRSAYQLTVEVEPVTDEAVLANNTRTYRFEVERSPN